MFYTSHFLQATSHGDRDLPKSTGFNRKPGWTCHSGFKGIRFKLHISRVTYTTWMACTYYDISDGIQT